MHSTCNMCGLPRQLQAALYIVRQRLLSHTHACFPLCCRHHHAGVGLGHRTVSPAAQRTSSLTSHTPPCVRGTPLLLPLLQLLLPVLGVWCSTCPAAQLLQD